MFASITSTEGELRMPPALHRQTLGDLLRRTARALPRQDRRSVCGDVALDLRRVRRASCNRLAAGLAARRASRTATASPSWRATRTPSRRCASRWRGSARCWCRSTSCSTPTRSRYILRHAGARLLAIDSGLAELGRERGSARHAVERFVWLPGEDAERSRPPACCSFDALRRAATPRRPSVDARRQRCWRRSSTPAAPNRCPRARC